MPCRTPTKPEWRRTPPYRSHAGFREGLRAGTGLVLLALVAACAGCSSMSNALDDGNPETGSISPRPVSFTESGPPPPQGINATDWQIARLALDEALSASDDVSIPWDNPETGARGTATPIGPARAGECRDFMIAILVQEMADRWVRGEACRKGKSTALSQVRVLGQV